MVSRTCRIDSCNENQELHRGGDVKSALFSLQLQKMRFSSLRKNKNGVEQSVFIMRHTGENYFFFLIGSPGHLLCDTRPVEKQMHFLLLTEFVFVRDTSCRQTDALVPIKRSMHISQCNHSAHSVWPHEAAISKLQVVPALLVQTNKTVIPKILVSPAVELEPTSFRMQWKQCIYHTCCWICLSLWIRWQWGSMYCRWMALQKVFQNSVVDGFHIHLRSRVRACRLSTSLITPMRYRVCMTSSCVYWIISSALVITFEIFYEAL